MLLIFVGVVAVAAGLIIGIALASWALDFEPPPPKRHRPF